MNVERCNRTMNRDKHENVSFCLNRFAQAPSPPPQPADSSSRRTSVSSTSSVISVEAGSESERTRLKEVSSSLSFASMLNGFWLQPETFSSVFNGRWRSYCGRWQMEMWKWWAVIAHKLIIWSQTNAFIHTFPFSTDAVPETFEEPAHTFSALNGLKLNL